MFGILLSHLPRRFLCHAARATQREGVGADHQDAVDRDAEDDEGDDGEDDIQGQDDGDNYQHDVDGDHDGAHPHPHHHHSAVFLPDALDEDDADDDLNNLHRHVNPSLGFAIDSPDDAVDGSDGGDHQAHDTNGQGAASQTAAAATAGQHTLLFAHLLTFPRTKKQCVQFQTRHCTSTLFLFAGLFVCRKTEFLLPFSLRNTLRESNEKTCVLLACYTSTSTLSSPGSDDFDFLCETLFSLF